MKKKLVAVLATGVFMLGVAQIAQATTIFSDNFESGNLNSWTVGGRQLGTNVANVVTSSDNSNSAHLYHAGFTEISLYKDFQFNTDLSFQFDLEVDVYSQSPPAPNYYGSAGVWFDFLDSNNDTLGYVFYGAATTNYLSGSAASNPIFGYNQISENIMSNYSLSVSEMLSQISIDSSQVSDLRMSMNTYSSTWPYPTVTSELWVDNVVVSNAPVPEPTTMLLFGTGIAGLAGTRIRRKKK